MPSVTHLVQCNVVPGIEICHFSDLGKVSDNAVESDAPVVGLDEPDNRMEGWKLLLFGEGVTKAAQGQRGGDGNVIAESNSRMGLVRFRSQVQVHGLHVVVVAAVQNPVSPRRTASRKIRHILSAIQADFWETQQIRDNTTYSYLCNQTNARV